MFELNKTTHKIPCVISLCVDHNATSTSTIPLILWNKTNAQTLGLKYNNI